ncbi:MAG: transposase [Methylocystis silviterrae]|uniref:IS66-like element accessory protein TnpA n=1 Tax=Methylocystis silviterrae TaxID=2743612 RepID=UPI003C72C9AF
MHQARHDADSYRRVEVITGGRRRRDWSDVEKARIVAESAGPDANISEVARRNGVSRGLLTVWRRQAREASHSASLFARVEIESHHAGVVDGMVDRMAPDDRIEIEIADARVFVPPGADPVTLKTVVAALRSAR